jgi:hypothetical protein
LTKALGTPDIEAITQLKMVPYVSFFYFQFFSSSKLI